MLVAVGVVDQRPLTELRLQAIGIQLGLLLADPAVAACALGLDHRQRFAVVTPQHVIDKALALVVGHACNLKLAIARLIQCPAGFLEQQVDVQVARLRFVIVVLVGLGVVRRLGRCHLGAQTRQLFVQGSSLLLGDRHCGIAFGEVLRQLLQRHLGLRSSRGVSLGQNIDSKLQGWVRSSTGAASIVARQPERHLEQLTQHTERIGRLHRPRAVHGVVALLADDIHLRVQCGTHQHLEAGLEQKCRQVRLVGHLERAVGAEQPGNHQFERPTRVEAGCARVGRQRVFGAAGLCVKLGPADLQEREVGRADRHRLTVRLALAGVGEAPPSPAMCLRKGCIQAGASGRPFSSRARSFAGISLRK